MTIFQMFKRYAQYAGGTCDPFVISWPKGIKARGEIRNQYHHSVDIVPTLLEIAGLEMPKVYKGVDQYPLSGVSRTRTDPSRSTPAKDRPGRTRKATGCRRPRVISPSTSAHIGPTSRSSTGNGCRPA
jgi:arylsulfatase A-like enzyme